MTQTFGQLPAGIREGDIIASKYRIENVIGAGAMGVVVCAYHLLLEEKVAIKFLSAQAVENREAVSRFMAEARAAVKIKSEYVARVSDVGILDDATPYIVMEYLEGSDLAHWLADRGPLSVGLAVEFILQACEALAEAHSHGIVHRDLKPANLFVVERVDGVAAVKVLDFGISKSIGRRHCSGSVTDTTTVLGSPSYMSPEQMESAGDVDARADVWSLGAILCELITGKLPYDGPSLPQVYAKIVAGPPPQLRSLSPHMTPEIEAVIVRCLERNRALRYRNVAELAAALMRFAPQRAHGSVDRVSRVFSVGPGVVPEPPTTTPNPTLRTISLEKTLASFLDPAPSAAQPRSRAGRIGVGLGLIAVIIAVTRSVIPPSAPPPIDIAPAAASPSPAPAEATSPTPTDPMEAPTPVPAPPAKVAIVEPVETSPRASEMPARGSARLRPAGAPRSSSAPEAGGEATAARSRSAAGTTLGAPSGSISAAARPPPTALDAIAPLLQDQK